MADLDGSTADFASNDPIPAPRGFAVTPRRLDQLVVLTVTGDVDMLTAPRLTESLLVVIGEHPDAVVVDLTDVDFLGSAAMTALVTAHRAIIRLDQESRIRFAVVADGPVTARPLDLTGLSDVIDVYPTLEEALAGRS